MLKRHLQDELEAYLKLMPVVLLTGARQTGKTTLVETLTHDKNYFLVTFDDELSLSNAKRDPSGWLAALPKPLVIDEVQRVPEIFLQLKKEVDQDRVPGRYLLTGSANPLLIPKLGDSLAGRMGILTLYPFSQGELQQKKETFLSRIFQEQLSTIKADPLSQDHLFEILLKGGFPVVQTLDNPADISRWLQSYLQTMMERDVRDLSNIEGLREFPRLFRLLATRSAMLLNTADISRSLGLVSITLSRYLRLLETLYFIELLPAWYSNLGKRLIKSPKLHFCDTSIMAELLNIDSSRLKNDPSLAGQFLETFVFGELLKQKSWSSTPFDLYHFRDGDKEVDFVLEKRDGSIIGIEVKSSRSLQADDLRGLKHLQTLSNNKFYLGIVLHMGSQVEPLGPRLWALPLQALWN